MADIRINSLPSTATSFNTDDYIAIDGASGGTRKMLAATLPLTDVTLGGSSGPSVKSTLSARAPRQGLVFDGSAGATGTAVTIGTADLTFSQWVRVPSTVSETRGLFLFSPAGSIGATSLLGYVDSDATLNIHITGATSGDRTKQTLSGFVTSYAGKWVNILFTRVGSTWTGYINGVATTFSASTSGTAPTWAGSISGAVVNFGSLGSSGAIYNDAISAINLYNRALSASEVVALYEAGAPAGADYNSATNTSLITGDNSTFASDTGYWTLAAGATISGGNLNLAGNGSRADRTLPLSVGKKYRAVAVVTANTATDLILGSSTGGSYAILSGTGTLTGEFVASSTSFTIYQNGAGAITVDSITLVPMGLLLAPDAAQAGGGLVWYDTSGNAANITLPASGVSWNVPSSQKTASGWTFGGNLTVSGTGTTGGNLSVRNALGYATGIHTGTTSDSTQQLLLSSNAAYNHAYISKGSTTLGIGFSSDNGSFVADDSITITAATKLVTLAGNLTVSGTGTQTLNGKLDVITAASSAANVDIAVLRQNYAGTAGHEGLISFTNISGTSVGKIGTRAVDGSNTSLVLRNFVSGSLADALTLSPSVATLAGNLTVSGGQALISHSGSYANIYFAVTGSAYSEIRAFSSTGEFRTNSGPSAGWGGFLTWQTDASEKMRLTNGGNLGIGTTSPNAKLEIGLRSISGSEPNQYLRVNASTYNSALSANLDLLNWGNNYNSSLGWRISAINSAGVTTQRDLAFSSLVDAGSGTVGAATERMRLFGTGNLFIGASPVDGGQKLQVSGTANFSNPGSSTIANFTNSANADFQIVLTASTSAKIGPSTPTSLILQTNGTTALTLDSSQRAIFSPARAASNLAVKIISSGAATNADRNFLLFGHNTAANAAVISQIDNTTTGAMSLILASGTDSTGAAAALTLDSSQNATFAGGIIGMTQGNVDNISDDGVASFTPLYNRGFIVINNPDYSQNALIAYFKAGSSYLLYSITKSADVTLNNSTTLTGTTGTDGKLNIGYNNSIIYIENRLGGIGNFQRYALGGTNN